MKKILITSLSIIAAIVIGIFILSRFFNVTFFNSIPVVNSITCAYPVAVSGNSMEPAIKSGSRMVFNRCIEQRKNLSAGTIVLYKENNIAKISRIKERIAEQENVSYITRKDNRADETARIAADRIIAVWEK